MRVNGCSKPKGAMKVIFTRWCLLPDKYLYLTGEAHQRTDPSVPFKTLGRLTESSPGLSRATTVLTGIDDDGPTGPVYRNALASS